MKEFWDQRYSEEEFVYGKEPNQFLKEELHKITPGKVLFLGKGEGRNAVYAVTLGWEVDAVDYSESGKVKAEQLSSERGVKINYHVEDLYSLSGSIPRSLLRNKSPELALGLNTIYFFM